MTANSLVTIQPLADYLTVSEMIDWDSAPIAEWVRAYRPECRDELAIVRDTFTFVRDQVAHSWDIGGQRVTASASDALTYREGICYAKSHLLAALLRAMGVPSGLCYQRLVLFEMPEDGFCVHSLTSVYLSGYGRWIRLDARGNKPGVYSQFSVGDERLAFTVRPELGERDYWENYAEPHPAIVKCLAEHDNCAAMYAHGLPTEL